MIVAGDASGDTHAAALVEQLRRRAPDTRFVGLGGVAMEKAGVELVVDQREVAVAGLVEVLGSLPRLVSAWRRLVRTLRSERPHLVVLVDSPDLCIPFARRARRVGVPVLYYVSPQLWAWRPGRARKLARRVDRMAAIFPFEPDFYAESPLRVELVGHPLLERIAETDLPDAASARRSLGLDPDAPWVALLPGSRSNEIRHNLPLFLEVVRILHAREPRLAFALALAPTVSAEQARAIVEQARLPAFVRLAVVEGRSHEAIRAAEVVLAMPGTATLETALLARPLVVAARVHPISAWLARRLVRVSSFVMPNLVAGRRVVPEFLQEAARPEDIAQALLTHRGGAERSAQLAAFASVRERLRAPARDSAARGEVSGRAGVSSGSGPATEAEGASARTAAIAEEMWLESAAT